MKINYSKDVTIQLNENVLTINAEGKEFNFDVTFTALTKDGGTNVESITDDHCLFFEIKHNQTLIDDLNNMQLVWVSEDGIETDGGNPICLN